MNKTEEQEYLKNLINVKVSIEYGIGIITMIDVRKGLARIDYEQAFAHKYFLTPNNKNDMIHSYIFTKYCDENLSRDNVGNFPATLIDLIKILSR